MLLFFNFFFRRLVIYVEVFEFVEMSIEQEIFVIGIKVVDLFVLYVKGGKIGMLYWVLRNILGVVVSGYCFFKKCYKNSIYLRVRLF